MQSTWLFRSNVWEDLWCEMGQRYKSAGAHQRGAPAAVMCCGGDMAGNSVRGREVGTSSA